MRKAKTHLLSQPQVASSQPLYVPPKFFLLSVKKGEAQTLLLQQCSVNKMQTDFNHDSGSSSSKLATNQYTQRFSTGTYWRDTGTNNSTTISGLNQQRLDISFGKEPKNESTSSSGSCDMRMARLRQKQQNTLKELFQKTVSSLDQKLAAHQKRKESDHSQESIQTSSKMQKEKQGFLEGFSINKNNYVHPKESYSSSRQDSYSQDMDPSQQRDQSTNKSGNQRSQEYASSVRQNQSQTPSQTEPNRENTLKDIINQNKSISLLSQSLKARMQELEDKYLISENKGKLPKRVSWESQEENISGSYDNPHHKKSLSYANLTPHYDSTSISSAKGKNAYLLLDCEEFGSELLSKQQINPQHQNNYQPLANFKQSQIAPPSWESKRSNSMIAVTLKDRQQQHRKQLSNNSQASSEQELQCTNDDVGFQSAINKPIVGSSQANKDANRRHSLKMNYSSSSASLPCNSQPNSTRKQFEVYQKECSNNSKPIKSSNYLNNSNGNLDRSSGNYTANSLVDKAYSSLKQEDDNLRNNYGQKFKELRRGIKNGAQISSYF